MIESYRFGSITIDSRTYDHDVMVAGHVIKSWEQPVRHRAGLDDVKQALQYQPKVVIIGTGESGMLEVDQEVTRFLVDQGIELFAVDTRQAIKKYNHFVKAGTHVVAFLHLTC